MEQENKGRIEIEDKDLDVSGGRVNLGQVMGEVANAKEQGKDASFLGELLKTIFGIGK